MSTAMQDDLDDALEKIRGAALDHEAIARSQGRLEEIFRRNQELLARQRAIQDAIAVQRAVAGVTRRRSVYGWLRALLDGS
jgi:hypothetical protein